MTPDPGRIWQAFRAWVARVLFRRSLLARLSAPVSPLLGPLFAESVIAMAIIDRQGRTLSANAALSHLLAAMAPAASAVPAEALTLFVPTDRDRLWQDWAALLAGEGPRMARITGLVGAEAPYPIEVACVPVRESNGTISGLVLSLSDISARQRLEEELVQARKLQAVGQLAGGIAHDFNNLLTAIGGAVEGVRERAGMGEGDTDLTTIEESAQRGAALVRQLLAFARQQTLQPEIVAVNEAVRGIAGLLGRLLGRRITLSLDLEEPGRHVRVDRSQLDQVLMNLAFNARDAMAAGGQLTLATGHLTLLRPRLLGAETMPAGRYVMITVTDSGVGIPPPVISRIFEPFFTTKRATGGSGLGLATVLGIMRQSGGFIAVESTPGEGTRIELFLPRSAAPALVLPPASAPAAVPRMPPGSGKVVLLVEDEEPLRRLAERALQRAGFTVRAAESGEAALALVERGAAPELVVSDVMMPGMDGPALVRALRGRSPALPAILVSGYAASELRGALAGDDVVFLAKPYTLKALQQAARGCLADAPAAR